MRFISFVLGLLVAGTVLIYPRLISADMKSVPHIWLVLLLLGMSFCFVHGVGFRPRNILLKILFSPIVAWPLLFLSAYVLLDKGPMGPL